MMAAWIVLFMYIVVVSGYDYPFRDPSLPWDQRVDDLVGRLTLEEIVPQLSTYYFVIPPEIPRLGIKPYTWITNCIHGVRDNPATAFPQVLGHSATFR